MREVLKNHKLLGSTMGSKKDLKDATEFLEKKRIVPCVGSVIYGLENAEKGFEMLRKGEQFGKVVIDVRGAAAKL
jgi:D-arabinose 1-dehydrogenase-like Zn-dependent alcohol dehydrogenase